MVADEFKELLHVGRAILVELSVVDMDNDLLKVVLLLLPVEIVLSFGAIVLAEVFVEYAHGEMLEVVLLNEEIGYSF